MNACDGRPWVDDAVIEAAAAGLDTVGCPECMAVMRQAVTR